MRNDIQKNEKIKASWVGNWRKVLLQYFTSIKSYFVYPFMKKREDATKEFFEEIYSNSRVDELIFDSSNLQYLDKLESIIHDEQEFDIIYDCGCGNSKFIDYIENHHIRYKQFIGIDFAIESKRLNEKSSIVNSDLIDYKFDNNENSRLILISNVACYLNDDALNHILESMYSKTKKTTVIIIEPIPSLFWDACFDNIKLYYRNPYKIDWIMNNKGFKYLNRTVDYLIYSNNMKYLPLSSASLYSN